MTTEQTPDLDNGKSGMNAEIAWEPVKESPAAVDESIAGAVNGLPPGVYFVSKSEIGQQIYQGAPQLIVKRQEEKK